MPICCMAHMLGMLQKLGDFLGSLNSLSIFSVEIKPINSDQASAPKMPYVLNETISVHLQ